MSQVNNLVTFNKKSMVSEDLLNQMIETLGIAIDSRPNERPRKKES